MAMFEFERAKVKTQKLFGDFKAKMVKFEATEKNIEDQKMKFLSSYLRASYPNEPN